MRPSRPHPFLPPLFLAFRLVYIPASILSHTGHGLPYLNVALVLSATFGMEYLTRRSGQPTQPDNRQREAWFVVVALLLLGLFPEEAPASVILWAAIGGVWGWIRPGEEAGTQSAPQPQISQISSLRQAQDTPAAITLFSGISVVSLLAGGLLGLTGLFGPGSWLLAGLLAFWGWRGVRED